MVHDIILYMLQVNSYFSIRIVGLRSGGALVTINRNNKPELYFRYDEQRDVVLTDNYNPTNQLVYQFTLIPVHPREIYFVNDKDST